MWSLTYLNKHLLVRMLTLRRGHSAACHALLSTARIITGDNFRFESLALDQKQLLPASSVTRRVLEYLEINPKDIHRVLSSEKVRPLPHNALSAPQQVRKLTPLARWCFQQLKSDSLVADSVFKALEPHANMARGMWRKYFLRQFLFSGAPLLAYLRVYRTHIAATKRFVAAKHKEANIDEDGDEEDDEANEMAYFANNKPTTISKKKDSPKTNSELTILSESKEWEWVPLHLASTIVKEFCYRGRFAEAIESYSLLPLSDWMRRDVVAILQEYEQYLSVLYLYEVHRTLNSAVVPLDIAPELDALNRLGRVEEMEMRFQKLPPEEQSRADIQKLVGN